MAPGVSSCHYREVPPSISFSGSGFMATYQLGVAQCFQNYAPWILRTAPCVLGASAGSLVAAAVVCEISPVTIRDEMLHYAQQLKTLTLGPFNPSINVFQWLELILKKYLPPNAHQLATGRLAVAVTHMTDNKLIILSEFESREEVLQALLCSCFVPGYCGIIAPSIKGVHYVDGGFSSMQPVLPLSCSEILTISPFSGETDICPADTPSMWDMVVSGSTLKGNMANSIRIINALYPMALETLEQAYHSGYKDAIQFLLSNDLVPYMMVDEEVQGPLRSSQNKTSVNMASNVLSNEKQEKVKVDKETSTPTPLTDIKCKQRHHSAEHGSTGQPPLHFDMAKNVLMGNVVTSMSMFGLPAKILSRLFLPLILSFCTALQSRYRLELFFRQAPELSFWVWQSLRYFTLFLLNIIVSTLKKNIKDRVMPAVLLFKWMKIQVRAEPTKGRRHTTPCRKFPPSTCSEAMRHESLHRRLKAPSPDKNKTMLQHSSTEVLTL